jgi:DNA invertase Pin-like site-specific DNA recombinase
MSVFGYVRCATDNPASVMAQREAIERLCQERGLSLTDVFYDTRCSGLQPFAERPGGDSLLRALKRSDMVVVSDFARLSRDISDIARLADSLLKLGVSIHLADDHDD